MAKDKEFRDLIASAGASELAPRGPEAEAEISTEALQTRAAELKSDINQAAEQAVADLGSANPDLAKQAEQKADESKAQIDQVVASPVTSGAMMPKTLETNLETTLTPKENATQAEVNLEPVSNATPVIEKPKDLPVDQAKDQADVVPVVNKETTTDTTKAEDKTSEKADSRELATDLNSARQQYVEALRQRKSSLSGKRKNLIGKLNAAAEAEFQAIKTNYEQLKKEEILHKLTEAGLEAGQVNEQNVSKYLEFLQQEEAALDGLATESDRSNLQKFQEGWKRYWKARLVAGTVLAGGGVAMSLTGVGAGVGAALFGVARGLMSGAGTYMGIEAQLDRRTKSLGQAGLIDQVANTGMKRKKIGREIVADAIKAKVFDQYSTAELRQEIARLRVMSLDKGVALEEAGRFGSEQAPLVKNLVETYYRKLREEMLPPAKAEKPKAAQKAAADKEAAAATVEAPESKEEVISRTLTEHIDGNIEAQGKNVVSALDSQRIKFMRRQSISAVAGAIVGVGVGMKAWDKFTDKPEASVDTPTENSATAPVKTGVEAGGASAKGPFGMPPVGYDAEGNPLGPLSHLAKVEAVFNNVSEVKSGDTVWSLAKDQLHQRLGAQFDQLDEARKTYLIDAIKDKVAANPSAFGLNHSIDQLQVGEKIDFSTAFKDPNFLKEIQAQAGKLDQAALDNIIHNNESLEAAAKSGIRITSANVDQIAAQVKEHGVAALNPDGSLRQAASVAKEVVQTGVENAEANAAEAAKTAASQALEKFMQVSAPEAQYDSQIFAAAKTAGSLDAVFNKVLATGDTAKIEHFINDWAQAEGLTNNKREIFLGSLMHDGRLDLNVGGQVKLGDGIKILQENLRAFDATVLDAGSHTVEEGVKAFSDLPKDQWAAVKVGDQYALVRRIVDHKLIFHKLRWLVSFDADHQPEMTIGDKDSLARILMNKTFGSRVGSTVNKVISANLDKHPPAMS